MRHLSKYEDWIFEKNLPKIGDLQVTSLDMPGKFTNRMLGMVHLMTPDSYGTRTEDFVFNEVTMEFFMAYRNRYDEATNREISELVADALSRLTAKKVSQIEQGGKWSDGTNHIMEL